MAQPVGSRAGFWLPSSASTYTQFRVSRVGGGLLGPLIGAHCFTLNIHQPLCRLQGEWDKGWRYLGWGGEEVWSRSSWGCGPGMWLKRNGELLGGVPGNLV